MAGALLAAGPNEVPEAGTFPWRATTVTKLNLRSGPGTGYESKGTFDEGAFIIVDYRTATGNWVKVSFTDKVQGPMEGYVEGSYLNYISQVNPPQAEMERGGAGGILGRIWKVLRWILIGVVVILLILFGEEIWEVLSYVLVFAGIGALIFYFAFDKGWLGALVGVGVALIIVLRSVLDMEGAGSIFIILFAAVYYVLSFPFYVLNQLQFFLSEPWRFHFKHHRYKDTVNDVLRPVLEVFKVLLYIAITPLRALNAVYYNIVVHWLTEMYDFMLEVLAPCSRKEGAGSFWKWMLLLPWRILKYPVFHGVLTLFESVIWTVIDIFVPAITLYHGTDLTAGQSIAGSRKRNDYLSWELNWDSGTFRASDSSWGGIGVYFAPRRMVAFRYASDPYRLSDRDPVVIVCRVTMGRIINYSLAPWNVYRAAGGSGHPPTLNRYGEQHSYTTGEWWNEQGGYWEYCLFDWQNLYNKRWRIRPIYIYNYRTRLVQHIKGGMAHWLFKF